MKLKQTATLSLETEEIKTEPIPDHLRIDYNPKGIYPMQSAWDKKKQKRLDTLKHGCMLVKFIKAFKDESVYKKDRIYLLEQANGMLLELEDELGVKIVD